MTVAFIGLFSYPFFTISVIVCLCIFVLVKCLFWITVWPCFGKKVYFWLSACGVLIVGSYFTYVLLPLGDLEWKMLCNCIDSLSLPSFLFPSCLYNLTNSKLLNPLNAKLNWITYFRFCYQSKLTNVSNIYTTVQFFLYRRCLPRRNMQR